MAKRRKQKDLKKLEEEEDDDNINIRGWIIKTVIMMGFMFALVYITEAIFNVAIITDVAIAIAIVITLGFVHEGLHYKEAVKLGYEVKWYRTKLTMGFDIEEHDTTTWEEDKNKIGKAPYKIVTPITLAILCLGIVLSSVGLVLAGVVSIILHIISYSMEGREV